MNDTLDPYIRFADFLAQVLGPGHEIVLQDLRDGVFQVVHIAGDNITNRRKGSPLTDLGLRIVRDETWRDHDGVCNYASHAPDGRLLRCSTFFIRNAGELKGMFCINTDVSAFADLSAQILHLGGIDCIEKDQTASLTDAPAQPLNDTDSENFKAGMETEESSSVESFFYSQAELIDTTIARICPDIVGSSDPKRLLSSSKRQSIVLALEDAGVFLMKGSVQIVAEKLGCSVPSIYRYRSALHASTR